MKRRSDAPIGFLTGNLHIFTIVFNISGYSLCDISTGKPTSLRSMSRSRAS